MADDEQPLTKRERQKQRKQAKREAEQAAQRRQRARKLVATGVVVVLALAALGGGVFLWQQSRAERGDLLGAEAEAAQTAGCQPVEQPADLGRSHFGGAAQLGESPPAELYDHRPATSGQHIGAVAATGVYDQHVDERLLLHNLEHGYVVAWISPELDEERRAEMLEWGEGAVADEPYLIVAEYPEPLPDGGAVGYVAWQHRQLCDDFDPQVADAFVDRFANAEQPADELDAGPHDGTGQGELVPGEDTVVFPPFEGADAEGVDEELEHDGEDGDGEDGDES